MRVTAEISYSDLDGDYGPVPGVEATCDRCAHTTESFGESDASVRRCLVLLREECLLNESNFYVTAEGDE